MAEKEPRPSTQIDLLDHKLLRRELEVETQQAAEDYGLDVSYIEDNMHLLLTALIATCGVGAHLIPGKFAQHRDKLIQVVIVYYVISAIKWAFSFLVMKDNFLVLCASEKYKTPRVKVSLRLKRFATDFTLKFVTKDRTFITPAASVEAFFHEDGYIAREQYHAWVQQQINALKEAKPKAS